IQSDCVILVGWIQAEASRHIVAVEFFGLPGQEPGLDLLRETIGISSRTKCLLGHDACSFMVAVAIAFGAGKTAGEHVRAKHPNGIDHIAQNNVMPMPFAESFFCSL